MDRVPGTTGGRHRLDVLAHGRVGAADHPDDRWQDGDGPAGPVEQALGLQPQAGLGDQAGDGALADGGHLLGHQVQLTPLVGPLQAADHATPARPRHVRQRRALPDGTFTSIWAARSRRVKNTHPPLDVVGR